MAIFEIYFSDLNEEAQKEILNFTGITKPEEMNWDIDMAPIALYENDETVRDRRYRGDYA